MDASRVFRRAACAAAFASLFAPAPAIAAVVNWVDGTGFWDVAANWSSNPTLPGAADDVVINVGGLLTVTHRQGSTAINSLTVSGVNTLAVTGGGTLTVTNFYSNSYTTSIGGGALRLNAASSTAALTMTSGTLSGPGTVTAGTLNWTGGTMGESGQGGGTTTVTGSTTISGTGSQNIYYGRTLNLNGDTTWNGGDGGAIYVYSAGQGTSTLNIGAGTTFTDAGAATGAGTRYLGYYGDGIVNNAGTYVRNGLGTTSVGPINNTGTFEVQTGAVNSDNTISNSGSFSVASAGSVTGAGHFIQSIGYARVDGFVTQELISIQGGTVSGTGSIKATGSPITVGAGATVSPGNSPGTLTMIGDVNFSGLLDIDLASGASWDQLYVTGLLGLASGYRIDFDLGFSLTDSFYNFKFLQADGGISGFDPSAFSVLGNYAGYNAQLVNLCGSGGCEVDLRLTRINNGAAPEPGTLTLLGFGLAGLAATRRRRQ